MTTDLERRLRQALHDDAQRARLINPQRPPADASLSRDDEHSRSDELVVAMQERSASNSTTFKQRAHRRRLLIAAAAIVVVIAAAGIAIRIEDPSRVATTPPTPTTSRASIPTEQYGSVVSENSALGDRWLAVATLARDDAHDGIYLLRGGEAPRRLELPGSDTSQEVCPAFAPQSATSGSGAQRLMISRRSVGPVEPGHAAAELVIVEVEGDGSVAPQRTIPLDRLGRVPGLLPCAIWSPDGNWAALGGAGAVWVVNTKSGEVRELSGYDPTDLEWRPGTDELAITGNQPTPEGDATDAPVDIYTVSTAEIRGLGAARASNLTWSPDGTTLAFTGGEDRPGIWLVNADGTDERQLTEHLDAPPHGTGVTWSPDGALIAYQRRLGCCESNEAVLVTATADDPANPIGTETVIPPPQTGTGNRWYPYNIIWSPDGTHLVYFAWASSEGVIAVPIRAAGSPIVITDDLNTSIADDANNPPWIPLQPWSHP